MVEQSCVGIQGDVQSSLYMDVAFSCMLEVLAFLLLKVGMWIGEWLSGEDVKYAIRLGQFSTFRRH